MVQQDENQKGIGILPLPTVNSTASFSANCNSSPTTSNDSSTIYNSTLETLFSRMDNGKHSQFGRKDRLICSHCGFKGHTIHKCYKLHGYPPGYHGKNKASTMADQVSRNFVLEMLDH